MSSDAQTFEHPILNEYPLDTSVVGSSSLNSAYKFHKKSPGSTWENPEPACHTALPSDTREWTDYTIKKVLMRWKEPCGRDRCFPKYG